MAVADRVLGRLYLSTRPGSGETGAEWIAAAAESIRDLKDFAILADTSAMHYLQAAAEAKSGHAFFLGQALAMLDEPAGGRAA